MAWGKKNKKTLVHSPQKVLSRSCAHETPFPFQVAENLRCAVKSLLERSVCLQRLSREMLFSAHLPHKEGTDLLVSACQEGITVSLTQRKHCRTFLPLRIRN